MYRRMSVPSDGTRQRRESQGEKPAFLQMNQQGMTTTVMATSIKEHDACEACDERGKLLHLVLIQGLEE